MEGLLDDSANRLHLPSVIVGAVGLRMYTGHRIEQSIRLHLSAEPQLQDVPAIRRTDLLALQKASRQSATLEQVASLVQARRAPEDLSALRLHLDNPVVRSFAMQLTQTVGANRKDVQEAVKAIAESPEWRRQAMARIASFTGVVATERMIGEQLLPYVLQSTGIRFDSERATRLGQWCDALAVARVHLATRGMADQEIFNLILNLEQERARRGEAFELVVNAFGELMPGFLQAYAAAFSAESEKTVEQRLARR